MNSYIYQSAIHLAKLIREGKATSTDIVKQHLERIKEHNTKLNALISLFEDEAIAEAEKCDREAAEGRFRGPLHGVPVTIKEQFWIKGKKSNTNFKMLKDFVAPEDAVIVKRIRESGAIILGQTNVPRNLTDYQVYGDIYPDGKNPYNTDYSPGGSTGGGAAALSAGFTPLELGGDLGGSVRVPASFCGLYGLKPTEKTVPAHGNIPLPKNIKSYIFHMAQAGPLARNVEDLELLWKIIVGPHETDRSTAAIDWQPSKKSSLSEYKIAWTDGWPGYETSGTVSTRIRAFVDELQKNGAVTDKKIPDGNLHEASLECFNGLFPYIIAQGTPWIVRVFIKMQMRGGILKGADREMASLLKPMKKAFKMNANHYGEMMYQRNHITERWEKFFSEYDFLICPVAFGPAHKRCKPGTRLQYEGKDMLYIKYVWPYVACFNASGHPSITIPLGLSPEGLPVGVQVIGKYWSEPMLIEFAKKAADLTDGFVKPSGY